MNEYIELINKLRQEAEWEAYLQPHSQYETPKLLSKAADIIEKLSEERKKGKWKWYNCVWVCSCCGKNPTKGTGYVQSKEQLFPVCPYCGADMRGET